MNGERISEIALVAVEVEVGRRLTAAGIIRSSTREWLIMMSFLLTTVFNCYAGFALRLMKTPGGCSIIVHNK